MLKVIIPARGGSKRIPRKNMKAFLGVPIIERVISTLKHHSLVAEIIVSTDDTIIRQHCESLAVTVIDRTEKNANDTATTDDVILEVLERLPALKEYDLALVYPTAVLLTSAMFTEMFEQYIQLKKQKIVFTATAFNHPPQRGFINTNGIELLSPEHRFTRTQDLPKVFHDAGAAYIFNYKLFGKSPFSPHGSIYEVDQRFAQDIDEEADWEIAEMKYKKNAI
jgi:pseudaminic acid cytidylyltransferase